jgi:flagellar protein FlbD
MLSGKSIIVREKTDEILDRIVEYRRRIGGFKNEE